jgi:hypothetical protein
MWNERLLYTDSPSQGEEQAKGVSGRLKDRFKGLLSGW